MKYAIAVAVAFLALGVSGPTEGKDMKVRVPTAPCAHEDGPRNCFWDAGVRGNGKGHSLWYDEKGMIHYLDPNFRTGR